MERGENRTTSFDTSTLEYLRLDGTEVEHAAGQPIVRRGDPGSALFIVLEGTVEVRIGRSPHTLTLARLGPGSTFGEISILRGVPATADVVAVTAVRLLRYPAALFPQALAQREALRRKIMDRLAKNLEQTTVDAWGLFREADALRALVRQEDGAEPMIAESARSRSLASELKRLAATDQPVLISGEPGTGKTLAARTIHEASARARGPLVVIECRKLPRETAITLFATDPDRPDEPPPCFEVAPGGTVVLRDIEALPEEARRQLASLLADHARLPMRLLGICLEAERLGADAPRGFPSTVRVAPLRQRPRDVLPLARAFLARMSAATCRPLAFTAAAERSLVSLRYRSRNVAELRDIVELAARCSADGTVTADHLFSGLPVDEAPIGRLVPTESPLSATLRGNLPRVGRAVVLGGFLAVIVACLAASGSALGRSANALVWSGWEPVVFGLFLLAGPIWCTVCPLSTAARLVQRVVSWRCALPAWLKTWGAWLAAAGFFLILWSERAFEMTARPAAAAGLLIALLLAAVALAVVFAREVWCRHLCPLGRLAAVAAPAAPLALAADRRICSSTCTMPECYRGTFDVPGCTVFHHPQLSSQAHNCKLCLDCLRSCPHGATALYVRPPLSGGAALAGADTYAVPFALSVFTLAPVFLAAGAGGLLTDLRWLTTAGLAALALGALLTRMLPRLLHGRLDADSPAVPRAALALAVLGWGPLLAAQLGNVSFLAELRLLADPGFPAWLMPGSGLSLQHLAQVSVVAATALAGTILLRRARRAVPVARASGWRVLAIVAWLYVALAVGLLGRQPASP